MKTLQIKLQRGNKAYKYTCKRQYCFIISSHCPLSINKHWSYLAHYDNGLTINKCMKIINGNWNKRKGYRICMWNCRRGLVDSEGLPSEKFTEVIQIIQSKHPHLQCLIESDLHGLQSRAVRQQYMTTESILDKLKIDGYKLLLLRSPESFGQAQLIL